MHERKAKITHAYVTLTRTTPNVIQLWFQVFCTPKRRFKSDWCPKNEKPRLRMEQARSKNSCQAHGKELRLRVADGERVRGWVHNSPGVETPSNKITWVPLPASNAPTQPVTRLITVQRISTFSTSKDLPAGMQCKLRFDKNNIHGLLQLTTLS